MIEDREINETVRSTFGPMLGTIALDFLNWRPQAAAVENSPAPSSSAPPSFVCGSRQLFIEEEKRLHPDLAGEDLEAATALLWQRCKRLTQWIEVIWEAFRLEVGFDADQPIVAIGTANSWLEITSRIDPDCLVCHMLARRGTWDSEHELLGWGLVTRIGDHDLDIHLASGVADLHVHLGGFRSGQVLWRNLITGRIPVEHVYAYSPSHMAKLSRADSEEFDRRIHQIERIREIREIIIGPPSGRHCGLRHAWRDAHIPAPPPPAVRPDSERTILWNTRIRERSMLAASWGELLRWQRDRDTGWREAFELERSLYLYLFTKNAFLIEHAQPRTTNPGLNAFRRYYRSTKTSAPRRARKPGRSPRVISTEFFEYGDYIGQSRHLKKIELRLGPYKSVADYFRFFLAWEQVEREFGLSDHDIDIRFAIHFKRSLDAGDAPSEDGRREKTNPTSAIRKVLSRFDRETAILHMFLHHPRTRELRRSISRVDFAGSERECPGDIAAYCVNLLRGQPEASASLDAVRCDPDLHRSWIYLKTSGRARPRHGAPPVGITWHAGEDYSQPLEGIYSVASAVHCFKMRAGDTIGHGLALGHDLDEWARVAGLRKLTGRGNQFDAVLWLYETSMCHAGADIQLSARGLEPWLRAEATAIYGGAAARVPSLRDLAALLDARVGPVPRQCPPISQLGYYLRHCEVNIAACARRRGYTVPVAPEISRHLNVVKWAQSWVMHDLMEKGIILEFNPSSNLRVSGAEALNTIPFVRLLNEQKENIFATLSTDNPGVFTTRIENEYALVMSALLDLDITRPQALRILERLRDVGNRFVSWPV